MDESGSGPEQEVSGPKLDAYGEIVSGNEPVEQPVLPKGPVTAAEALGADWDAQHPEAHAVSTKDHLATLRDKANNAQPFVIPPPTPKNPTSK